MTSPQELSAQAITILLVEDDPPTPWRLQDALVKVGFDVAAAATLGEARASLAARVPRVLPADLQLPDGHGVDLIREVWQRHPDTEITAGATGYILKDAFPSDITATVHAPASSRKQGEAVLALPRGRRSTRRLIRRHPLRRRTRPLLLTRYRGRRQRAQTLLVIRTEEIDVREIESRGAAEIMPAEIRPIVIVPPHDDFAWAGIFAHLFLNVAHLLIALLLAPRGPVAPV